MQGMAHSGVSRSGYSSSFFVGYWEPHIPLLGGNISISNNDPAYESFVQLDKRTLTDISAGNTLIPS